jgi:small conductance mechanosensitive channel
VNQVDPTDIANALDTSGVTGWDVVWAIGIVAGGFLIAAVVRQLVRRALRPLTGIPESYRRLIAKASGWFVVGLGIIWALVLLGVDLGPAVIGLLILAAIAFFAGRGLLENFAAGLVLQSATMFAVGDQIETVAGAGTVLEITGRTVVILTPDGEQVHVPNTTVVKDPVTNLTKVGRRRSTVAVGVAYGSDLEQARDVALATTRSCELVVANPEPDVIVTQFTDDAIELSCRFWHNPTILGARQAVDEVSRAVYVALREHDIEFAFPQRTLWWGPGQKPGPGNLAE